MADVTLVPERDVFHRRHGVRAHEPREARDVFGKDWVALVWHRGGAFLPGRKGLFGLLDFGALKVAHLDREFFQRARDHRERGEEKSVAVALDDLVRDRRRLEARFLTNVEIGRAN